MVHQNGSRRGGPPLVRGGQPRASLPSSTAKLGSRVANPTNSITSATSQNRNIRRAYSSVYRLIRTETGFKILTPGWRGDAPSRSAYNQEGLSRGYSYAFSIVGGSSRRGGGDENGLFPDRNSGQGSGNDGGRDGSDGASQLRILLNFHENVISSCETSPSLSNGFSMLILLKQGYLAEVACFSVKNSTHYQIAHHDSGQFQIS